MNALADPDIFASDAVLYRYENKSLLRFIACGSVDHGKSSLLGRLLYEAKLVPDDQLATLRSDSRRHGSGDELDFSLLFDGLAAEREQKITIDLAYRFFATEKRKFIVADAPGHEQYTRNMATGASTADLALILVNAQSGLTQQTRRHALIATTLGVRHLLVAVNKMDLVEWSQAAFADIEDKFRAFAGPLGAASITFIPTSARGGDNVVNRSAHMDWYRGPTLLEHLETVDVSAQAAQRPFRMPVQWVNRPDADFRGYCGLVAGGAVRPGMAVRVLPSGQWTTIERIVTAAGELAHAEAGQSVTLTLTDEVDASRGDMIVDAEAPAMVTDQIDARIFWMGQGTLAPGGRYLIKLGTAGAAATVTGPLRFIDLAHDNEPAKTDRLMSNEFGLCRLQLDRPLATDRYDENRETGSFILIDAESHDTVAMGLVENSDVPAAPSETRSGAFAGSLLRRLARLLGTRESHARSIAKAVSWRATGSVDTFVISFVITGSGGLAGTIAVTEIATKILFYYFHERLWALVPWGHR
jgi:sulfate adenylyltransferase large subunit